LRGRPGKNNKREETAADELDCRPDLDNGMRINCPVYNAMTYDSGFQTATHPLKSV